MHEDNLGICWVGTTEGLNTFDPKKGKTHVAVDVRLLDSTRPSIGPVYAILEDHAGHSGSELRIPDSSATRGEIRPGGDLPIDSETRTV